jgi:rod shape-determining protein MreC
MRHFFSNRIRLVLVAALLIAVVLAVVGSLTGTNIPGLVVQGVLTPLRTGAETVLSQAEQIYDYIFEFEALKAENEALKQQLAHMQEEIREADSLARENERYKALLKLKEAHEDYELVDAYIIARSSSDWTNTITINRGSNAGIEPGMCAITANGEVVGLVTEVGGNFAVIKTVLDSSLEISAMVSASGYAGMVTGGYITGNRDMLRMDYLPSNSVIRNRDQVVTAGSTVYPRNLILGYVVDAGFNDTGVVKYAILEPAADIGSLEQLFILTKYDTQ